MVNASTLMERKRTNSSEFTPLSSIQPFDGTEDGGSDEVHSHGNRSWRFASITVVGEIVGSGVLGLPYAMKNLGWLLGIAACPIFGLCAAYAGHLLSRAKNSYRPKCKSYVDLAEYTMGSGFAKFTRFAIMLNWVMLLPYYMVGATDALLVAISSSNVCFHHASLIVVVVLIVCLSLSLSFCHTQNTYNNSFHYNFNLFTVSLNLHSYLTSRSCLQSYSCWVISHHKVRGQILLQRYL